MYAILGKIEFDLITYFDGMETKFGADYAEHALIGRKPRLQHTGDKLDEVNIELVFHISYCDPEAELLRLRDALVAHDVLALVLGNGDYKGRFVITELSSVSRHTDKQGALLSVEARVALREFTGDPAEPKPPAVRPAGSALPLPASRSPVAAAIQPAKLPVSSPGALAQTLATAKSALATTATTLAAVKGLKSLAGANPTVALGRLPGVLSNVSRALPGLGASATALQRFDQAPALGGDAGRIASGILSIRSQMAGIPAFGNGATTGNVLSRLSSMESLADRAAGQFDDMNQPMARLAARAATRAG